jgi:transcriptional regulator with XRE-family HTH domain
LSSQTLRFSPEALKQRRLDADLTTTKLAASVDVSADTLTTWESGRRQPRVAHLAALSSALDCAMEDLFVYDDAPASMGPGRLGHADATPAATQRREGRTRGQV